MANTSNAQAALQAAVTVYAGSRGYLEAKTITDTASWLKLWLDAQDAKDAKAK